MKPPTFALVLCHITRHEEFFCVVLLALSSPSATQMLTFKSGVWGGNFPFWFFISNSWRLMLWRCCFSSRKTLAVWNSHLCPAGCLTSCSLIVTAINLHIKERLHCALLGQFTPTWQNNHLCIYNAIPALLCLTW